MALPEFTCPYIAKKRIWEIADKKRAELWPQNIYPIELEEIIEIKLKMDIDFINKLFYDFNTIAYLRSDFKGIVVDYDFFTKDNLSNPLRFALAHELGHYFLHKDLYSELPFETHEDWIDFHINNVTEKEYRFFEGQANQFAGRFLVPDDLLREQVEGSLALIKNTPNIIKVLKENPDIILSGISPPMRRFFGVSEDVIERRVFEENLWPPKIKSLK